MSKKKINCKDGLTHKQEIEARRLRQKIEANDPDTWAEIIKLRKQWLEKNEGDWFLNFLSNKGHIVLYSAILRIKDKRVIEKIYFKNEV